VTGKDRMSGRSGLILGFVGFGEAAYYISLGLKESGLEGAVAYDILVDDPERGPLIEERAAEAGVTLVPDMETLVGSAELVLSLTSAAHAVPVAREAACFLARRHMFVDMNAAGPDTMETIAEVLAPTGTGFVDVALMGPVPSYRHRVPMLASGEKAEAFKEALAPFGCEIEVVGNRPGAASALKMFRSVYTKGVASVLLECLAAADRYGVMQRVFESLVKSQNEVGPRKVLERFVTGAPVHAPRWVHEMQEVVRTLEKIGIEPVMTRAALRYLEALSDTGLPERLGGRIPSDYREVPALIRAQVGRKKE